MLSTFTHLALPAPESVARAVVTHEGPGAPGEG